MDWYSESESDKNCTFNYSWTNPKGIQFNGTCNRCNHYKVYFVENTKIFTCDPYSKPFRAVLIASVCIACIMSCFTLCLTGFFVSWYNHMLFEYFKKKVDYWMLLVFAYLAPVVGLVFLIWNYNIIIGHILFSPIYVTLFFAMHCDYRDCYPRDCIIKLFPINKKVAICYRAKTKEEALNILANWQRRS